MKKLQLFLFLLIAAQMVNAGVIEKTYFISNPEIKQMGEYQLIQLEGSMITGITGEPALPYVAIKLLLPPGEIATSIEFIGENDIQLPGNFQIYPQQSSRPLSEPGDNRFIKNETLYASNSSYPQQQTGHLTTSFMNGYAIAVSSFTPVKFNPATGAVTISQKVKIKITTAPDFKSGKALNNLKVTPSGRARIQNFAQNISMVDLYPSTTKTSDDYQFLIITPSQFENSFNDLRETYLNRGLKTELVTKETINSSGTGQDLQEKIRNYIIQEYQDHGIEFVLLGGDVEHIPYRGFYCYVESGSGYEDDNIPADLYYSALDGTWNDDNDNLWGEIGEDDLLPEVAVGRFSFSNAGELANMLNKTLMYQNEPVPGEFNDALMAGEWLYANPETWGSDYLELLIGYHNDNGYETWGIPESYNFTKLYEANQSWGASDLMAAINSGKQYVHHVGHANSNYVAYMYNSDITNSNFYGANGLDHNFTLFHSHGCICGAFDDSDCIMEKMVSIENFAVAVIGNSRYGWFNEGQTEGPAQHLHREMVDALYHERLNHIGQAFVESKIQTAPWVTAPGQWEEGALRWNFYDINILGDPVLSIWTGEPIDIQATYQNTIPIGVPSTNITVTSDGSPVENLTCAVLKDGLLHGVGTTDGTGMAQIEFDPVFTEVGDAELIVSGYNCLPESFPIAIIPNTGAYVIYSSHQIDDSQGNGNGLVDFGETISLTMELENVGTQQANNVEVMLSTASNFITITDGFASFGNIPGGSVSTVINAFSFNVASNIPDQSAIMFEMEIIGEDTWNSSFNIVANAPNLAIGELSIDDSQLGNGDGILDPGEIADILIQAMNTGHCSCSNSEIAITTISSEITITNGTFILGTMEAGESNTAEFTIEVDENATIGSNVDLTAELSSGEYFTQHTFYLNIGLIYEDFETGDFSAYAWEFGGNADWLVSNQNPYEGTFCAKSGNIDDQQESELLISMDVIADGEISFYRKVSSESGWDYLRFYIDGSDMGEWSGESGWVQETYTVSVGTHTFKWAYEKDGSVSNGQDCGWIDYIVFPASSGSGNSLSVNATASPSEICLGESAQLNAYPSGGSGNYTFEWSPTTGLNDPFIADPIATPDNSLVYTVTVSDGSTEVTDGVPVIVNPVPETPVLTQEEDHLLSSAIYGNQWYNSNGAIAGATGQTYYPEMTDHYYVIASNEFGCYSEQSNVIYFIFTGINKNLEYVFSIFPNPVYENLTVEYILPSESDVSIVLFNQMGQEVDKLLEGVKQNPGFYQMEFSLPNTEQGIYFITITSDTFYLTRKLIIQ